MFVKQGSKKVKCRTNECLALPCIYQKLYDIKTNEIK